MTMCSVHHLLKWWKLLLWVCLVRAHPVRGATVWGRKTIMWKADMDIPRCIEMGTDLHRPMAVVDTDNHQPMVVLVTDNRRLMSRGDTLRPIEMDSTNYLPHMRMAQGMFVLLPQRMIITMVWDRGETLVRTALLSIDHSDLPLFSAPEPKAQVHLVLWSDVIRLSVRR